ncbi:MAG TPA: DUF1028 domain-containing protein [Gemmatimonadaceae bacterium]|nr:DUF1028 domain-containing protein [Gemmatimonadaceae bacterium]
MRTLLLLSVLAVITASCAPSRDARPSDPRDDLYAPTGTFSIIAYDTATGEWGGAVQSRVFSVGNGVLWAEANVGIVATQAIVDVSYGPQALALLRKGKSAKDVVQEVWKHDPDPVPFDLKRTRPGRGGPVVDSTGWTKLGRQFAVVDAKGNVAAYTGPKATPWAGDRQAPHVTAQGNILAGPGVVDSMIAAYLRTPGHISLRLVAALEAGDKAGGDTRGKQSAALIVVKKCGGVWLHNDQVLRLQVDDNPEPIAELRRLVQMSPPGRGRSANTTDAKTDKACK